VKECLRRYPQFRRALKVVGQSCPTPNKLKEYRFERTPNYEPAWATTCLGPTVLTTHPLLAPSLQMGWRNTAVCICVSWGDLYLYTDSWEVLHNIFTNHQKLKYYVIVSSPLNRFPQHPIMKRHHSVFPKCWRPSFASLHINGYSYSRVKETFFFLDPLFSKRGDKWF
jgi:hypothetical protein